jgi:hypothetical protein
MLLLLLLLLLLRSVCADHHASYSSRTQNTPATRLSMPHDAVYSTLLNALLCCLQIIKSLTSLPHPEYSSPRPSDDGSEQPAAAVDSSTQQQQQHEDAEQQQQQRSERHITLIASTRVPQAAGCPTAFRMRIPKLQGYFTGTGVA